MLWRNPHRRFQERLSAYLDGELQPDEALALETHLESCDSCREELAGMSLVSAALAELPDVEVPRSFALTPEQVAGPAITPSTVRSLNSGFRLAGGALAAALAVVLVLDIGGVVGDGGRSGGGGGMDAQQEAAFGTATGAAEGAPAAIPTDEADGALRTGSGGGAEVTSTPRGTLDGDGAAASQEMPSPAPTEVPGDAAAELGLNGSEEEDTGTFAPKVSTTDDDDGLSALTVTEIVLAVLLGATLIGAGVATYAVRRRA